jgi:CHAD domain-containing protein
VSRTHNVQSSLKKLKSLQTTMGKIHDIHKLRKELVAWVSSLPAKRRALGMAVASELQKEVDSRMVEFKDHSLVSGELLPSLQVQTNHSEVAANSSN